MARLTVEQIIEKSPFMADLDFVQEIYYGDFPYDNSQFICHYGTGSMVGQQLAYANLTVDVKSKRWYIRIKGKKYVIYRFNDKGQKVGIRNDGVEWDALDVWEGEINGLMTYCRKDPDDIFGRLMFLSVRRLEKIMKGEYISCSNRSV